MENRKDSMEQIIVEDLLNEAEAIDREIEEADIEIPVGLKDQMKEKLHAQIDEYEKESIYAQLSEEDREALKLGREMIQDKKVYRKKSKKMYVAVAAVAVLVLAMGVTSIGGAERIAEMMQIVIGNREIVRVDTEEDNYVVQDEQEEVAYQKLKDVFGVDPVKIFHRPGDMKFVEAEIDEELQTAFLKYEYEGNIISYFISSHHTISSWGFDVEDQVIDQYIYEHKKCKIQIREYEISETKKRYYSASYEYKDLEYRLLGIMGKEDFQFLIENLKFF